MTEPLSHGEIQELLGAYALDAVDQRERDVIEAHLPTCESCRVELDDHRRLAETLRRHAVRVSPLASSEANGTAKANHNHIAPSGRLQRWALPAAVAVVAVLVGAVFAQGQVRYRQLSEASARIERLERAQLAATDPAAVVTALRTPDGEPALTVVDRGGGSYAINSALPRLAAGRSYQLWRVDATGAITAAASLGTDPDAVPLSLPARVTGFVITVENTPAPRRPTLPAVASSTGITP